MAEIKGEWEGFVEEYNIEELYIFDNDEEVRILNTLRDFAYLLKDIITSQYIAQ